MPAFIKSSTVQQAEQEALKLGVQSVDYRQNLDIANIVNDALDVAAQRGVPSPNHLKVDVRYFANWAQSLGISPSDLPAAFTFNRKTGKTWIYLNPQATYWSNPAAEVLQEYQAQRWSSNHPHHAVWHELGHLMFFQRASTVYWKNPPLAPLEIPVAAQVSQYATQSLREFIAETLAALLAGRTLPPDVLSLYQQHGGVIP